MTDAQLTWVSLATPWQVAFEQAWMSFSTGSAGVGAVVADAGGHVVSVGRSRVFDEPDGTMPLIGTWMAHAEMNALAQLPRDARDGHTLFTTFEPCVMCAATIRIYRIPRVVYAAADPVWDGLHDLFAQLDAIARGLPERDSLGGPWGAFGHVLHLSWLVDAAPPTVVEAHSALAPAHLEVAARVAEGRQWRQLVASGGTVVDAAAAVWDDLVVLGGAHT